MVEIAKQFNKHNFLYQEDLKTILSHPEISSLQDKSILITGATGLLGVCLIDALMYFNHQDANIQIYAITRNREKASTRLGEYYNDPHFHLIELDVREPLPAEIKADYIIPLASNTHPLSYSLYPIETIDINVKGAEYALQKATECGATLLYPSTVEIYGNAKDTNTFTEDYTGQLNLATSRACYTESKRVCEALCLSYISEKKTKVKIVRLSRIFGPTMLFSDTKASSQFITKALSGENIVLKSKGDQFFSYTYVADAVSAMLFILLQGEYGIAYNISNEKCDMHLKDFANYCAEWADKKVVFDLPSAVETKGFSIATKAILDNKRIKSIGWEPKYEGKDAIFRTLNILKDEII